MSIVKNIVEYTISLRDLLSAKIKTATQDTDKLNKSVTGVKSSLSSLGKGLGIGLSVAGVASFGKAVVESLKNYEYFSASLRTLMHGDGQASKALETQLVSLAAKTPFSLVEIQDATKQLMAYGFSAGTVTQNISMLGDVASALKIPFGDIAYLYGTLKTQGRAYTRDIMQFTSRGIPIIAELAKQYGITDDKVKALVESGKVGFPEVEKAFKSMTSEGGMFFNMMAEQTATVGGQISALGDNWEQLKVHIGQSQQGVIAGTISFVNEMVSTVSLYYKRQNQLTNDLHKYHAQEISTWEHYGSEVKQAVWDISNEIMSLGGILYNPTSDVRFESVKKIEDFNNYLQTYYVEKPAQTMKEARKQYAVLASTLYELDQRHLLDDDNDDAAYKLYGQKRAALLGAIDALKGQEKVLKDKPLPTVAGATGATGAAGAIAPVKASAPKATTININYGSLSLNQDIKVLNGGNDFTNKVGDNTAQALMSALNDVNRIATTQ